MIVYNYDNKTLNKIWRQAEKSQVKEDEFIIPAFVTIKPKTLKAGFHSMFLMESFAKVGICRR